MLTCSRPPPTNTQAPPPPFSSPLSLSLSTRRRLDLPGARPHTPPVPAPLRSAFPSLGRRYWPSLGPPRWCLAGAWGRRGRRTARRRLRRPRRSRWCRRLPRGRSWWGTRSRRRRPRASSSPSSGGSPGTARGGDHVLRASAFGVVFGLGRDGSVRKKVRRAASRLGYFGGFGTGWRRRALGAGVWWRGGP